MQPLEPCCIFADGILTMDAQKLAQILFSFNGRMGRTAFWVTIVGLAFVSGIETRIGGFVGSLLGLTIAWVLWASIAKRAHDRNKSVLSVILAALPFMISILWFMVLPGLGGLALGPIGSVLGAGLGAIIFGTWWLIGGVWLLWELGIQGSEPGTNIYGAPVQDLLD
jgi:uncharacterized membrane protein YhaH (DUF805 family)